MARTSSISQPHGFSMTSTGDKRLTGETAMSGSTQAPYTLEEKRLVRKLDRHIVPLVMLLYCFSFLDRVNIGNAKLYNLEKDLGMTGNQFQTAVSLLFITYLAFEIPSNLVLKKFKPSRWIAFITCSWGIVATLTGICQSYSGLIACRLVLGACEAGLFPGCAVYLTFFYTKRELALRIGYLFVSAAIAGAFGGLLAFAIGHMEGIAGLSAWRWIMIVEGIPTFIIGLITLFFLADDPESAKYLTEDEKILCIQRLKHQYEHDVNEDKLHKRDVVACFKDWKCWAFAIGQFGLDTMLYGYSTFLPTIIKAINKEWSAPHVQALTIPCYALGAITYLLVAHYSDVYQKRGLPSIALACVSILGYVLLISPASQGVHYLGCFLVAMGLYVAVGIPLSWNVNNLPRYGKKTTANGFQLTLGNASGVMAPFLYVNTEAPRFVKGHAVTLAMIAMGAIIYTILLRYYMYENNMRRNGKRNHLLEGKSKEEIANLGDDS